MTAASKLQLPIVCSPAKMRAHDLLNALERPLVSPSKAEPHTRIWADLTMRVLK